MHDTDRPRPYACVMHSKIEHANAEFIGIFDRFFRKAILTHALFFTCVFINVFRKEILKKIPRALDLPTLAYPNLNQPGT